MSTERIIRRYVLWRSKVDLRTMPADLKGEMNVLRERERRAVFDSLPIARRRDRVNACAFYLFHLSLLLVSLMMMVSVVVEMMFRDTMSDKQLQIYYSFHRGIVGGFVVLQLTMWVLIIYTWWMRAKKIREEEAAQQRARAEGDWLLNEETATDV